MRSTPHGEKPPKVGDKRVVRRFLWLPYARPIQGEPVFIQQWRWLEWATIIQVYVENVDYEGFVYTRWHDKCWAKEPHFAPSTGVPK